MTEARPVFRLVAAIALRTKSVMHGIDFLRKLMSGIASMLKKGFALLLHEKNILVSLGVFGD